MTSETTREFRQRLAELPPAVRAAAKRAYVRWQADPWHPALQFKVIHQSLPIYSARVGLHWRAIGIRHGDKMTWFWVGSHEEYDHRIESLRRRL